MPIRFKCPNCQKGLVVKDELAGKKVKCPACKGPVTIPAPIAPPADLEDFAAAALASDGAAAKKEAAPEKPKEAQPIKFTCDFCGEVVEAPAAEAGKRIPCPNRECRQIIKVPLLKEEKPKDWRDVQKAAGPSFAKRDEPAKPLGTWDDSRGKVSQESLEEAGVVLEEQEPVTVGQRVRFWGMLASAGAVAFVIYLGLSAYFSQSAQKKALDKALTYVEPKSKEEGPKTRLSTPLAAEVYRAVGEFHVQARQAEPAREAFVKARAQFAQAKVDGVLSPAERDLFLIDLAVSQVDLGGTEDEARDKARLEWDQVQGGGNLALKPKYAAREIDATLQQINSPEARALAMRAVAAKLFRRDKKDLAIGLANSLANVNAAGGGAAFDAQFLPLAQVVSLLVAAGQAAEAAKRIDPPTDQAKGVHWAARLAYAEGHALQGNFDQALKEAQRKGLPRDRLLASLAVAAVALDQKKVDEARANAEHALAAEKEMTKKGKAKTSGLPSVLLQHLARVAVRAGLVDKARELADAIPDRPCRARAQLEFLLIELAKRRETGTTAEPKLVDEFVKDKETLAYGLGHEAVARHNSRLGAKGESLDTVETLEERFRPLVYAGVALGIQDTRK